MEQLIQLKTSDLQRIRKELLIEQDYKCPITGLDLTESSPVDHKHKLFKDQEIGQDGAGLVRGVIDHNVNSFEGKLFNAHRRMGLHKLDISLSDILRNLADYYDNYLTNYIHPREKLKEKKVSKRNYNKLKREYNLKIRKKKFPEYPSSSKLTKPLKLLFEEFDISPYN